MLSQKIAALFALMMVLASSAVTGRPVADGADLDLRQDGGLAGDLTAIVETAEGDTLAGIETAEGDITSGVEAGRLRRADLPILS